MSSPRLLGIRSYNDAVAYATALLTNPQYFTTLAALVILGDAVLTQLIIRFASCTCSQYVLYSQMLRHIYSDTEIDWETYIYQLELYLKGERNYAEISGPTGPLVFVFLPLSY